MRVCDKKTEDVEDERKKKTKKKKKREENTTDARQKSRARWSRRRPRRGAGLETRGRRRGIPVSEFR